MEDMGRGDRGRGGEGWGGEGQARIFPSRRSVPPPPAYDWCASPESVTSMDLIGWIE